MAWKITTGFLVFLLSLAFVSSKTEYQKAKLHGRKGLIKLFHWISSKSYFLVRWKFVRIAIGVPVIYLFFGFVFSNTSAMSGMINLPTTKLPGLPQSFCSMKREWLSEMSLVKRWLVVTRCLVLKTCSTIRTMIILRVEAMAVRPRGPGCSAWFKLEASDADFFLTIIRGKFHLLNS